MITFLDACPVCPPGLPDAAPAVGEPFRFAGGTLTDHQCDLCGSAWSALWWGGWVIDRALAPVAARSEAA